MLIMILLKKQSEAVVRDGSVLSPSNTPAKISRQRIVAM
jgi:hypothetical protein